MSDYSGPSQDCIVKTHVDVNLFQR